MTYENPVLATIDGEKYDYIKDTIEIECDSSYFRVICWIKEYYNIIF